MKKFDTIAQLTKEYAEVFNQGKPEWKRFSAEDVEDVCVERIPSISFNRMYGTNETAKMIFVVRGFGYVVAG